MAQVTLQKVRKVYANGYEAVKSIDLAIHDGEFMVLVGPSGCAKSTTLRMIAGLEDTTAGHIMIDGRDVTDEAPARRKLAMVFQSYALYPHMTVAKNIAFPLKMAGEDKAAIEAFAASAASTPRRARDHELGRDVPRHDHRPGACRGAVARRGGDGGHRLGRRWPRRWGRCPGAVRRAPATRTGARPWVCG